MPGTFDRETLDLIDRAVEVDIETLRRDGNRRRRTIWAVVDENDVFIRSWRGDRAGWYLAALRSPDAVSLLVGGQSIPVRAVRAADDASIDRCSRGFETKYAADPAWRSMVRPQVLGTTLRLEPR